MTCNISSEGKPPNDLSVESDAVGATMQAFSRMPKKPNFGRISALLVTISAIIICITTRAETPAAIWRSHSLSKAGRSMRSASSNEVGRSGI